MAKQTLPTIVFSEETLEAGSSSWISTTKQVVRALEEFGTFIAIYSNFSPKLHRAIREASKESLDLPTEAKMRITSGKRSHAYIGSNPHRPLVESFGIENASTEEGVHKFTHLLWPSGNDSFSETVLEYSKVMAELDQMVVRMVAEVYGITNSYESLLEKTSYLLRFIKYRVPNKEESDVGLVPHKDPSFTTILHQLQVKGLQVQTKSGDWISVKPSPSALVFMTGDAFMGWTNGRVEPPVHKVVMDGSEDRYSVGQFAFVYGVEIQVPEELVDEDHPLQFKPFDHLKYYEFIHTEECEKSSLPSLRAYCGV